MNIFERTVAGLCHAVLWTSTSAIFVILVANTVLRYSTGASLQWANEVPELLFPWLVTAGVVLGAQHGSHITTTFMVEKLPLAGRRIAGVAAWLVVCGLYITLAVATWRMLGIAHDEKSAILQVPGSVTYGCVMVGMALLALLALRDAWRIWHVRDTREAGLVAHDPVPHW
jgi:TRAP-type C4-dicarboxylate transport system permease small subunit